MLAVPFIGARMRALQMDPREWRTPGVGKALLLHVHIRPAPADMLYVAIPGVLGGLC